MPAAGVKAIRLAEKLESFSEHWCPKIVARYNGNDVLIVKIKGEFVYIALAPRYR